MLHSHKLLHSIVVCCKFTARITRLLLVCTWGSVYFYVETMTIKKKKKTVTTDLQTFHPCHLVVSYFSSVEKLLTFSRHTLQF